MLRAMIAEAAYNIWLQRKKYISTIVGIMVGIFGIVVMQLLGNVLKEYLKQEFKKDYYFMTVSSKSDEGLSKDFIEQIEILFNGQVQAIMEEEYGDGIIKKNEIYHEVELECVSISFFDTNQQFIKQGKKFTINDYDKSVCIISETLYKKLHNNSGLGKKLQIYMENNSLVDLNVIGIYEKKTFDEEEIIYLPQGYGNKVEENSFEDILFAVKGTLDAEKVQKRVDWFKKQNNLEGKMKIDIENDTGSVIRIIDAFSMFIIVISIICFLIGELNIMCMMIMRVKQSINEIGIRKAVGARKKHIFQQYFSESLLLSILGFFYGVIMGGLCSVGILIIICIKNGNWEIWKFCNISIYSLVGYFIATTLMGSLMGIYPAIVANRLNVIDALRKV